MNREGLATVVSKTLNQILLTGKQQNKNPLDALREEQLSSGHGDNSLLSGSNNQNIGILETGVIGNQI